MEGFNPDVSSMDFEEEATPPTKREHKFSDRVIRRIRNEYLGGATQQALAIKYNTTKKMIYNIVWRVHYKHIELPLEEVEYFSEVRLRSSKKRGK